MVARMKLVQAELRDAKGFWDLYPMASADTEELRRTYRVPGVLKVAILESTVVKVRKVRRVDRMTL